MDLAELKQSGLSFRLPGSGQTRASGARKTRGPEEELHRSCVQYAQLLLPQYPLLNFMFHSPNGGGRSKAEGGALKAMGVKPGVPDLIIPFSAKYYKGLAIELKAGNNKLTPEQRNWLKMAHQNNWLVGVARNLDEFKLLLMTFLKADCLSAAEKMPGWSEIAKDT